MVEDDALGKEAEENREGATSECVCCILFSVMVLSISYLNSGCPSGNIDAETGIELYSGNESIMIGRYCSCLISSWWKGNWELKD